MKFHLPKRVLTLGLVGLWLGSALSFGQWAQGRTLTIMTFSDEFKTNGVIADFEKLTGAHVDLRVVPNEQYMNKLIPLLRTHRDVPDIFVGEAGYIKEVVNLGQSVDLGAAPYYASTVNQYPYAAEMGRDRQGVLRALTWQTTPGGLFFRRSIALKVFGTDDPIQVGKHFSTWSKFIESGKILARHGYYLLPEAGDLGSVFFANKKEPYFDANHNWHLDPIIKKYFEVAKALRAGNMDMKLSDWSAPWMDQMNTPPGKAKVFAYLWPTWGLFFVLSTQKESLGDWGICHTPLNWYWGGTWLNIYKNSPNKDLAWAFISMMTQNEPYMEKLALRTGDFSSDKVVVKTIMDHFNNGDPAGVLGGHQNHYKFFAETADKIDASGVSSEDRVINQVVGSVLDDYLNNKFPNVDAAMKEITTRVQQMYPDMNY